MVKFEQLIPLCPSGQKLVYNELLLPGSKTRQQECGKSLILPSQYLCEDDEGDLHFISQMAGQIIKIKRERKHKWIELTLQDGIIVFFLFFFFWQKLRLCHASLPRFPPAGCSSYPIIPLYTVYTSVFPLCSYLIVLCSSSF